MKKIKKSTSHFHRVFAAVLAAALLFTMPGMASYAEADAAQTEDISESVMTEQAEDDAAEETEAETEAMQEPEAEDSDTNQPETGEDDTKDTETDDKESAEDETVPTQKEDAKECTCGTLCTQDSINGDCPVCGAEDADLSRCKGEKTENSSEENKEDAGQEDVGEQDDSANLCAHHKEHTEDCGYSPASEDEEGNPCTYECRICPIEDLIAALPDEVTEDNSEKVRAQLNKILALYRELTEEEQEQIDMTLCYDLLAELDEANIPMPLSTGDVVLSTSNRVVTFTAEDCGDNCQGHTITQETATMGATTYIIIKSGTHNVTFSGLNITPYAHVGVMPDATMNLTLNGTNTIQGEIGIYVPEDAKLVIGGNGSLNVSSNSYGAGIGGALYDPAGEPGDLNCGIIVVNGGTITAKGADLCAGIGGAEGDYNQTPGNGGNVTINGGIVTAMGGSDGYYGGAGIGGGTNNGKSGCGGTLTINGGNVTLTAGHSTAYGFGKGSGNKTNSGPCELTLADASYLDASTTLDPNGTYSINGDPTPDMIVVPTDLVYTGQTHDLTGKIYIDDSKTGTTTLFERSFSVTASADGWVLQNLGEVKEAGEYTVTFTKGDKSISTTFTVAACPHTGLVCSLNGDGMHSGTCEICGTVVTGNCTYSEEYTSTAAGHVYTCTVCGGTKTEAHTTKLAAEADGTVIMVSEVCTFCGYEDKLGTVTFTIPAKLTYNDGQMIVWKAEGGLESFLTEEGISTQWQVGEGWTSKKEYSGPIPAVNWDNGDNEPLPAGKNNLKITVSLTVGTDGLKYAECTIPVTIVPAPLTGDMVKLSKAEFTYSGGRQKPVITVDGLTADVDYTVTFPESINTGTYEVTIEGKGNYAGTVKKEYTINKANVSADNLQYTQPTDFIYTGAAKTATVTADNSLSGIGQITVKYKKDNKGDLLTEAVEPGIYYVYAVISDEANYNDTQVEMGSFTISYMDAPELRYNGDEWKEYYSGDVSITAVPADSHIYIVSDAIDGEYKESFTISAQQGTVTKTLYFKDEAGHISDGVPVTVKFDLTPPTGEIAVGAKWWQNVLNFISFGNYAAKDYTVTIKAEDKGGSGIDKIEYAIVTGTSQYTDVESLIVAKLEWKDYDSGSKPTVSKDTSQYVVYARLTDNAGNVTYISTDGILLDRTPPTVTIQEDTIKDVTAGFIFTISEAADYYYVVLPKDSAAPSAEDIIFTCGGTLPEDKTGNAINGVTTSGKGAVSGDTFPASVSVEAGNLSPNMKYTVYVTAVDRALDITSSGTGTPNGNIGNVAKKDFTTKKTLPVITKAPTVTGTYGQSVGEMTITGGAANGGNSVLTGTWTVSDTDKDKKPAAGKAEEVTVTFTPDNDSYDSISVKVILTVSQRSLNADGVTISEVAGTYTYTGSEIKPSVAVNIGNPASGINISDSRATLTENDFTVSYSNNKNAGTASVTITGKGNYTGTVTRTFTIEKADGRTIADLTGSYTDDGKTHTYTITPTEGAVYCVGDGAWTAVNEFKNITPGTSVTFSAKMPENENYKDGEEKSITVDFPKLTPVAPALSYKVDRTDKDNVKITVTPVEGAEYSFDGGTTWRSGEGANVQEGFNTSQTVTLSIRLKATDTHNQSPEQTVTVDLAKKDREAPPAFSLKIEANGETDYTVTIPPTEGCEYSFDGETWSESNVKTGAKVGETVTGYKRYKETDEYNASNAVSDSKQMPKFTVKTPVITPAGGSYTGSVSVTITCGSPDAEIYYTTDGSTPAGSSTRYTGAFTVTAPATVKAIAIKEGLTDSAVVTASYTKQGSGGSGGGNSGNTGNTSDGNDSGANNSDGSGSGNENSGDSGQGSNGGNGGGNTTPVIPAIPSAAGTVPGTGTETVRPGAGNTAGAETKTGTGSNSVQEAGTGTGIPFIKGEDGKTGWDVIRAEEEKAEEGSIINVDMNGTTVVPGDVFDSIKGRDITITFDMGNGIIWSVDGKSITREASRNKTGDIDFSVRTGVNAIPVDILNNVTGESYSIQLSLVHEGEFGFTAVLSINLGKENAGYTANLYYYDKSTGELEFICANEVAEDGTVLLTFTHASDYVIALEGDGEETAPESAGSITQSFEGEDGDSSKVPASPKDIGKGQEGSTLWFILAGVVAVILTASGILIWKRKKEEGSGEAR